MSYLENIKENLTHLAHYNAPLSKALLKINPQEIAAQFEFQNTEKNELNLYYKKKFISYRFHSESGAVKESVESLANVHITADVLYVFGVGLGYSFLTLRKWLEENPKLQVVYIEPLLPVLFHLLQTDLGKKIVQHPRVHLYHFSGKGELASLIDHLSVDLAPLTAQIIALPIYLQKYPKTILFFNSHIQRLQENLATILEETEDSREDFFRNFALTAMNLDGRYNGSISHQIFRNVPCIIVGAGPSLKKNLPLLKKLKDKAIILAGSSAISSLTQQGLTPHIGNYFDPYERVYSRFKTSTAFELPTFHTARTYFEVSKKIHGPQIYFKGAQATPAVNWVEDALGFEGQQIPELISVTASNTLIASLMGCNPIIYVGVDLAYTDNQSYSEGVLKDATEKIKSNNPKSLEFEYNADLDSMDIHGNSIKTRHGWVLESNILGELAMGMPHIKFLNSTEGGIGMPGINNLPLEKSADWFLKGSYPIEEMVFSQIQPLRIQDKNLGKKGVKYLKELMQSLNRCSKYYKDTLKEIKIIYKKNKMGHSEAFSFDFLEEDMTKIGHEIGYQYLLKRYHQGIDIPKLKHRHLLKGLSIDAPNTLIYEIKLVDMVNRFREYKIVCDRLRIILKFAIKQNKVDPWQ